MKLKTNISIALYIFIFALFGLISSPLVNSPGTDSAVFFVMGRGIAAGKIMYKELFDHKGLYTYFLNYVAALIDNRSTIGIFIVEFIFMFISAKFVHASFSLYADERVSWLGTQIFIFFAFMRGILEGGNLTEEYALMFQVISIYLLLRYIQDKHASPLYMFIHGINAGIVLFLRANLIMMWGGIAILVGYDLLKEKNFAGFGKNLAAGLLGLLAGVLPVIIYVVRTGSVSDAIFAIFTYNMSYINNGQSLLMRIVMTIFKLNYNTIILMLAIIFSLILSFRRKYYILLLALSVLSVSLSGRRYGHYYIYLVPFVMPVALKAALWINQHLRYKHAVIIVLAVSSIFCWKVRIVFNTIMFGSTQNSAYMEPFIEHNNKYYSEHEKVLVTGNSAGFYNRLGVIPHDKYFYVPASNYETFPEPRNSQAESIISGVNDVIIITTPENYFQETGKTEKINEVLSKNYELLYHDEKNNIFMYGRK
ncbi:MAG: hypothetical protein IJU48_10620 [Synergistaceae bacterium]|nr:hypothetical protein [Synergistaceae bacterium]